jgi:hypothetical protein
VTPPPGATESAQGLASPHFAIASVATARERIEAYLERSSPDNYPTVDALRVREVVRDRLYTFTALYHVVGFQGPYSPKRYRAEGTYRQPSHTVEVTKREAEWPWSPPLTLGQPPAR